MARNLLGCGCSTPSSRYVPRLIRSFSVVFLEFSRSLLVFLCSSPPDDSYMNLPDTQNTGNCGNSRDSEWEQAGNRTKNSWEPITRPSCIAIPSATLVAPDTALNPTCGGSVRPGSYRSGSTTLVLFGHISPGPRQWRRCYVLSFGMEGGPRESLSICDKKMFTHAGGEFAAMLLDGPRALSTCAWPEKRSPAPRSA